MTALGLFAAGVVLLLLLALSFLILAVLKLLFWLVVLPFRLLFWLIASVAGFAVVIAMLALAVPLLPALLLVLALCALLRRRDGRPVTA